MKKRFMFTCTLALLISMSVNVFATEGIPEKMESDDLTDIQYVDDIQVKSLPERSAKDLVRSSNLPSNTAVSLSNINIDQGTPLNDKINSRSVTQSWTGALANEGEFTYVTATLAPTQILNATLVCPQNPNLNYDLLVYEMDAAGNLGDIVSASTTGTHFNTYPNGITKTVDEGASFVNNTAVTGDYAIIVLATQGGSATDTFELTLSLDIKGVYDVSEPNDSAYDACGITEGNTSDVSLHVPNDQDWYMWNATTEFVNANVTVSAGYQVEVYTASGNKMILTEAISGSEYPIANGANYIRVSATAGAFSPSSYTLRISPTELNPAKIHVAYDGDMGKAYVPYPEGRYFRFDDMISVEVTLLSSSGYPIQNKPVDLHWMSGSWVESSNNQYRKVPGITGYDGKATLVLQSPNLPPSLGYKRYYMPGPQPLTHTYDMDLIMITVEGSTSTYDEPVYHYKQSIHH